MTCQDTIGFLLDYLERRLPPGQKEAFELHLSQCPSCAAYLTTYEQTIALGRDALTEEEEAMPDELLRGILLALDNSAESEGSGAR